ncbi:MAG: HAMP domain-containing histidine kinase [Pseudomonadota bacterium]|nr:HAMP domain-containing histidine kinase [Pseudomonadota bacterium]
MSKRLALHEFLAINQLELINRCRHKVAQRSAPKATPEELEHGIPLFLTQLIKTLRVEQTQEPIRSREVSGPSGGEDMPVSEIGDSAKLHGRELERHGFDINQVVHDYGDLCQAITDLAFELNMPFEIDEFRTLNRCLDNGIAAAVTEFSMHRDADAAGQTDALNERLGFLAHELRNFLGTAMMALTAIKAGGVGVGGATGAALERSLIGMRSLVNRSLTDVRMTAGMSVQPVRFSIFNLLAEVKLSSALEAQSHGCAFTVAAVDPQLAVDGDRDLLLSAVGNLLQNAFKFTAPGTEVTLTAYCDEDHIKIDVADHCGGLPPGDAEKMFLPFVQSGADRTGLGLGLSIARRSVEANGGVLSVRNIPGLGCVFSIDLPGQTTRASDVPETQGAA